MNKVMLVGRIVRNPQTESTQTGIKYSRFTIAVDRPYSPDQTDYVPIVAWRNQATFVESYLAKGALISIEGRFTSSTYTNSENQNITRYEIIAERVASLETKSQRENREKQEMANSFETPRAATETQVMEFAEENKPDQSSEKTSNDDLKDVPWELDL